MKAVLVLAILLGSGSAQADEQDTLRKTFELCLREKFGVACQDLAFQAEVAHDLKSADTYYKLACAYGQIDKCGYVPQKLVLKKPAKTRK